MLRGTLTLLAGLTLALSLSACSAEPATESGNDESAAATAASAENGAIKIEDIDWKVEPGVYNGESMMLFKFTNNSTYPIVGMRMEFQQKDGITDEQRAVFDTLYETSESWEDTNGGRDEVYMGANRDRYVEPGENCDIPCTFNFTAYPVTDTEQYELMEPKMATITYKADDKIYLEYYDFQSLSYSLDSRSGINAVQWSDSNIASMIPKIEAPVVIVSSDDADYFYARSYGTSIEQFESYVTQAEEKGFTVDESKSSEYYSAMNADGYEITAGFSTLEESLYVSVRAPE